MPSIGGPRLFFKSHQNELSTTKVIEMLQSANASPQKVESPFPLPPKRCLPTERFER